MSTLNQEEIEQLNEVKELLKELNVELRLIIAPPRTGSTMMEASIAMSDDVTGNSNEPLKYVGREGGFTSSMDFLKKDIRNAAVKGGKGILVVKDMTVWISRIAPYLHELTDYPILFLIRNPALSMESRLRRYMQKMTVSKQEPTRKWIKEKTDYHGEVNREVQPELFNQHAQTKGFADWEALLKHMKQTGDFSLVYDLVQEVFPEDKSGFAELEQQIQIMREANTPYMIVDTSEFRLHPESLQRKISEEWNLTYSNEMVHWGDKFKKFSVGDRVKFPEVWFGRILKSEGVQPPTEIPLPINMFPENAREHISQTDLPIYQRLIKDENRISSGINSDVVIEVNREIAESRGIIKPSQYPDMENISLPYRLIDPETHRLLFFENQTSIEGKTGRKIEH